MKETQPSSYFATDRWIIRGVFTTTSPLHIGSGLTKSDDPRIKNKDTGFPCEIALVEHNKNSMPVIPGSAIKGVLRSWGYDAFPSMHKRLDKIFGSPDFNGLDSNAGMAEFHPAVMIKPKPCDLSKMEKFVPFWTPKRYTGIFSHVSIDRYSGTAKHGALFFEEFVPELCCFDVQIHAERLDQEDINLLLSIIEYGAKCEIEPFQFGANTADGWGKVNWTLTDVRRSDLKGVSFNANSISYSIPFIPWVPRLMHPENQSSIKDSYLRWILKLSCKGPFLVNDTSHAKDQTADEDSPNFTPLKKSDGGHWLPASSLRGAIRERAEYLRRSLDPSYPKSPAERDGNDVLDKLFGHTELKSRLLFDEPNEVGASAGPKQDFVAIDRFTGGNAYGSKFWARYARKPIFETTIRIDQREGINPLALGLLKRALYDLCNGEISVGWGGSKSYGIFSCELQDADTSDEVQLDAIPALEPLLVNQQILATTEVTCTLSTGQIRGRHNVAEIGYFLTEANGARVPINSKDVPPVLRNIGMGESVIVTKLNDGTIIAHGVANMPNRPSVKEGEFVHPYYFLRLEDRAHASGELKDSKPIGHDRIHEDRLSGVITVNLTVKTPLLICDPESAQGVDHKSYSVLLDDGKPLLAASSIRGMLRSAYEAITNSRFGVFPTEQTSKNAEASKKHDRRLGYREAARATLSRRVYDLPPKDLLPKSLRPANSIDELSPADRVFGWVNQSAIDSKGESESSYKSHVRIGVVECMSNDSIEPLGEVPLAILAQPKPHQGRFYLGQEDGTAQARGLSKKESGYSKGKRIRGPKVYPHHYGLEAHQTLDEFRQYSGKSFATNGNKSTQNRSINGWVKPNSCFKFTINFENLSKFELGALLWLLSLPDDHYLRLGLGKPLGFGSVQLRIEEDLTKICQGAALIESLRTAVPATPLESNDYREFEILFARTISSFNADLLASFSIACQGIRGNIHYPRLAGKPIDEHYEWFMENEGNGKYSLPDLTSESPGLPSDPIGPQRNQPQQNPRNKR